MAAFGLSGHWKNLMPMLMKPATEFESKDGDKSHTRAPLRTDSFGFRKIIFYLFSLVIRVLKTAESLGVSIPAEMKMLANLWNRAYDPNEGEHGYRVYSLE